MAALLVVVFAATSCKRGYGGAFDRAECVAYYPGNTKSIENCVELNCASDYHGSNSSYISSLEFASLSDKYWEKVNSILKSKSLKSLKEKFK